MTKQTVQFPTQILDEVDHSKQFLLLGLFILHILAFIDLIFKIFVTTLQVLKKEPLSLLLLCLYLFVETRIARVPR